MAKCYPPPDDWSGLRVSLTDGERRLAEHLIEMLSDDWRLYLQPHVGGTRPDLVLVHPGAGVQLIEVKDYDLGAYDLSGKTWEVRTGSGLEAMRSPFEQVDEAREALFKLLLPFAGEARQDDRSAYGFVRAGVYLTRASSSQLEEAKGFAKRSLGSDAKHYGLASQASLHRDHLETLVPLLRKVGRGSRHVETIRDQAEEIGLSRPWHEILHGWLHPTPDEALQNEPLELTPSQKRAARHESGRLLVTGPAGSGKTLVVARRAAQSLLEGEDVLMLGFNITLWHYVRDYVMRGLRTALLQEEISEPRRTAQFQAALRGLTITHYHGLAYRMWKEIGEDAEEVEPDQIPELLVEKAGAVRSRAQSDESPLPQADTLVVDEGQDWGPRWMESLRPLLSEDVDITVAADPDQRIYGHAAEDPSDLFSETPAKTSLEGTARVPAALLPPLNVATSRWLGERASPAELEKSPQLAMDFEKRPNPKALWTTVEGPGQHRPSRGKLRRCLVAAARAHVLQGANPSQIAVLVPTHEEGLNLEGRFEDAGVDLCSLCVEDPDENRGPKHAFWRLDPRLKLTTVHSFKGWEADVVVVLLPSLPPSQNARKTLHVALTRTRAVVEVVAPPGGEDLPAWTHRSGSGHVGSVPEPDSASEPDSAPGPASDPGPASAPDPGAGPPAAEGSG